MFRTSYSFDDDDIQELDSSLPAANFVRIVSPVVSSPMRRHVARILPPLIRPRHLDVCAVTLRGSLHSGGDVPNQDASIVLMPDPKNRLYSVAAVFDGHGFNGHSVAQLSSEYFEHALTKFIPFTTTSHGTRRHERNIGGVLAADALNKSFKEVTDNISVEDCGMESGCTATVVIVDNRFVTLGWVGDSRALVVNRMGSIQAVTEMHRVSNESEARRVESAGGFFKNGYFVNSSENSEVSVTRALGDLDISRLGLDSTPEMETVYLDKIRNGAIVIASDGLWDAPGVSVDIVANLVTKRHRRGRSANRVCKDLLKLACGSNAAPNDDCTIVCLLLP